ncbi:MAG: small, acid-soluble spore protein, alpha/beta type [Moorellales bacterium]
MTAEETSKEKQGRILVPQAKEEMAELKEQVARELHLDDHIARRGWENLTTREVGKIGGEMVRRLVKEAEKDLAAKGTKPASPAGNSGLGDEFTPRQNQ